MTHDKIYTNLVKDVLKNGYRKENRTGIDTLSVFGRMLTFDVSKTVPIITTKRIHMKSVIHELLWMISGSSNIKYLQENGVTIWDEWADENGDLGPVYGSQWRRWGNGIEPGFDQLQRVIDELKNNPNSRRLVVTAWNAPFVWSGAMQLPPCHHTYTLNTEGDKLSILFEMRSVDVGLGLPFDIALYTILLHMIASITGYKPYKVVASLADTHIYVNHIEPLKEQILRKPFKSPILTVNSDIKNINDFKFDDIILSKYEYHPPIKMAVAV